MCSTLEVVFQEVVFQQVVFQKVVFQEVMFQEVVFQEVVLHEVVFKEVVFQGLCSRRLCSSRLCFNFTSTSSDFATIFENCSMISWMLSSSLLLSLFLLRPLRISCRLSFCATTQYNSQP